MRTHPRSLLLSLLALSILPSIALPADPSSTTTPTSTPATSPATQPRFPLAKDTTFFTAPLRPDGTIDYLAAVESLNRKDVTPQNNGYVLLLQATGTGPNQIAPAIHDAFLQALGIKDTAADFIDPTSQFKGDAFIEFDKHIDVARKHPWSAKDFPDIANSLNQNAEVFALLAEAARREKFYVPLVSRDGRLLSALLPSLGAMRTMTNLLAARAMLRLDEGKIDDAIKDLTTIHLLGRKSGTGPTPIQLLVGIAIEATASQLDAELASSGKLSLDQALAYGKICDALPPLPPILPSIDIFERATNLEIATRILVEGPAAFNDLAHTVGPDSGSVVQITADDLKNVDGAEVLHTINRHFDAIAAAAKISDVAKSREAFAELDHKLADLKKDLHSDNPTKAFIVILLPIFLPTFNRAVEIHTRTATRADLSRLALALAAYHAKNNAYPETLAPLAPNFLPAIPLDRFGNQPLHYNRKDAGYLLYSIGSNLIDDAGKTSTNPNTGDYAIEATH